VINPSEDNEVSGKGANVQLTKYAAAQKRRCARAQVCSGKWMCAGGQITKGAVCTCASVHKRSATSWPSMLSNLTEQLPMPAAYRCFGQSLASRVWQFAFDALHQTNAIICHAIFQPFLFPTFALTMAYPDNSGTLSTVNSSTLYGARSHGMRQTSPSH
jgi:hypothetical protein